MPFVKSSSTKLSDLKIKVKGCANNIASAFDTIIAATDNRPGHYIDESDPNVDKDGINWIRRVRAYNNAVSSIYNMATSSKSNLVSGFEQVYNALDRIETSIKEFETDVAFAAELDQIDQLVNQLSDSVYSDLYAYSSDGKGADDYTGAEAEDMAFGKESEGTGDEDVDTGTGSGGCGGGTSDGGAEADTPEDYSPAAFDTPYEGGGSGLGDYGSAYTPDITDPYTGSGSGLTDYTPTYTPSDFSTYGSDGSGIGDYTWNDPSSYDGLGGSGSGLGYDDGTGAAGTAADLIDSTRSALSRMGGYRGLDGTGADGEANPEYDAAGAAAVMLGLSAAAGDDGGLGDYLSNLASGFDDDRTLLTVGLEDVLEHPDYTNDGTMRLGNGENGYEDEFNGQVGAFDLRAVQDAGAGMGVNNLGADLAKGSMALIGAATVGGFAANAFMNYDEAEGGVLGAGAFGDGEDGDGSPKTLRELLFGKDIDEEGEDEEEKKKEQKARERLAIISTTAAILTSVVTFFLTNLGVINPIWFLISALGFVVALTNFMLVLDKKSKRREEQEAMKKVTGKGLSGKNKFITQKVQKSPAQPKPDWSLFSLVLISSSPFILKSYDVISWMVFLLLLLLFVLIIFVYIELKKRLGEGENIDPYQQLMGPNKK